MRLALALAAAVGLAGLSLTALPAPLAEAQDTASFNDKFQLTVTRAGGNVNIAVEGKALKDAAGKDVQWYVNTDYPLRLKLSGPTLGKAELVKDDAKLEGTEVKGKAKKASFTTTVTGATPVKIDYKMVVCSASSCSPPISGTFTETAAAPPPPPAPKPTPPPAPKK